MWVWRAAQGSRKCADAGSENSLGVWRIRPLVFLQFEMNMQWVKELQQSLEMFGWRGLDVEALSGLTVREVKQLLRERSKLEMIGRLID